MTATSDDPAVVVIGAGIAGCQAARALAEDHDVTVLDRSHIGAGATGFSAGLVTPTLFYDDLPEAATYADRFVREFDGTHGFEFTERDRLDFVSAGDRDEAHRRVEELVDAGFPVTFLDADDVGEAFPYFDLDGFDGAVRYEDSGWVDPYTYATALAADAEDRGATVETGIEVTEITTEHGRVTGVETTERRYDADRVVLAAGWRTHELVPGSVSLPIRPYRTQCLVLNPDEPLPERFPLGRLGDEHLYFRPEHNGDLLIGGAHETIDDPTAASGDADESFKLDVADFVPEFIDGFDGAGFVNGWAGVDVATPDTRPIVDAPPEAPDGLVVATGFNGLGVMISPIVGPIVRHQFAGDSVPFEAEAFSIGRFDSVGERFEYVSTSEL